MDKTKSKSALNILVLFLLLVVLPGGSIVYLSKGFQHQKDTYAELKDYGNVPAFSLRSHQNQIIETKDIKGKIVAVEFTTLKELKQNSELQKNIINLNSQFGDRAEFVLMTHLVDTDSLSSEDLKFLRETMVLKNPNQWLVFSNQNKQISGLGKNGYQLPKADQPTFALIDTSMVIRHYYDSRNRAEVGNLAKHIAMILPRKADKDAVLRREKEK